MSSFISENIALQMAGYAVLIFIAVFIQVTVNKLSTTYNKSLAKKKVLKNTFVFPLIQKITFILIIILTVSMVLHNHFNIEFSAIFAGLGLTGFALGYASKDVLSNLIAGIVLALNNPFKIDDTIETSGIKGKIKTIDLKYTVIEEEDKIHYSYQSCIR